jgi:hypothetical protein
LTGSTAGITPVVKARVEWGKKWRKNDFGQEHRLGFGFWDSLGRNEPIADFDVIVYNTLLDTINRTWRWLCFGASFQLLILLFGLEDFFGAFLNGTRYKGTYALTRSLRSFGHHLVSGSVQVSGDGMGKSLSRPTTFASVALWRHGMILVPPLRSRAREDHRSTRKRGRTAYQ